MDLQTKKVKTVAEMQTGFYAIEGADGHIYDSLFQASSHDEAAKVVQTAANNIRRSEGKKALTGKAQYLLGEKDRDARNWKTVDITPIVDPTNILNNG